MKNIWISLLVFCGLTAYSSYAIQHNLFYGHCTYDNSTIPIYTQVIAMDNPSTNQVESKPVQKRWYDFLTSPFHRSATTTPAPIVNRNVINSTVVFPLAVSFCIFSFIFMNFCSIFLCHRFALTHLFQCLHFFFSFKSRIIVFFSHFTL